MRNNKNLEWCMNLCLSNKEIMDLSKIEIQNIVNKYGFFKKVKNYICQNTNLESARYNMSLRFLKKQ